MPYMTLAQIEAATPTITFPNDNARAAWDQAARQAKADALRKGTQLLTDSAQRLAEEYDAWSAEAIEIAEGLEAVKREADRPDSAFRDVLKVSQDLDKRAKVLAVWKDQLRERMATHNERTADPVAHHEQFIEKWAGKSLTSRDAFLHNMPSVG